MTPKPTDRETVWSGWLAEQLGGQAEVRAIYGSRCDVLLPSFAVEVEWSHKWAESIGQATLYGAAFGRRPAIVLLIRDRKREQVYFGRCAVAAAAAGVTLTWLDANLPNRTLETIRETLRA